MIQSSYPMHLTQYLLSLGANQTIAGSIMSDEFVFSTYFAAIYQVFTNSGDEGMNCVSEMLREQIPELDLSSSFSKEIIDLDSKEKMMQIVKNLRAQFGESVTSTYVNDFFLGSTIFAALSSRKHSVDEFMKFNSMIQELLEENYEQTANPNLLELQRLLEMTELERRLIEISHIFSIDPKVNIFRDALFSTLKLMHDFVYVIMLAGSEFSLNDAFDAISERSLPIALGIVDFNLKTRRLGQMSEFWAVAISSPDDHAFKKRFVETLNSKKKVFAGAIAKASDIDEQTATALLETSFKNLEKKLDIEGINLLFYGPKSLNKKGYVNELLASLNVDAYQVNLRDAKSRDVPSICYVAQRYVAAEVVRYYERKVLIIDRAENALTRFRGQPSWLLDLMGDDATERLEGELDSDELLLNSFNVPTIWLVDDVSRITDENVGRFLFHVELKGGSRSDRKEEVSKVVAELGYSQELAQSLSQYYQLSIEQIKTAARGAVQLKDKFDSEVTLAHFVKNSQKALGRDTVEELRESVTKYSLDLLNLTGNMSPELIIKSLKKRQSGSICMYGPPGTGKTQLAEYIAVQLDKPLLIKPASEILNMYIGETEKNIAAMFKEATETDSVLFLDEADSMLRDRSYAQRSWEITQVNELLQRIERWKGIFICATNLFSAIDPAALRRFTFKLEFRPLSIEQRLLMLSNEAKFELDALTEAERENLLTELTLIQYLTPGDFATVKRQATLLDEELSVEEWLARLRVESHAKLAGIERNSYNHNFEVTERK